MSNCVIFKIQQASMDSLYENNDKTIMSRGSSLKPLKNIKWIDNCSVLVFSLGRNTAMINMTSKSLCYTCYEIYIIRI